MCSGAAATDAAKRYTPRRDGRYVQENPPAADVVRTAVATVFQPPPRRRCTATLTELRIAVTGVSVPLTVTRSLSRSLAGRTVAASEAFAVTMNGSAQTADPPRVTTVTGPDEAAIGTTAVTRSSFTAANAVQTPEKLTAVAPARRLPVMVMVAPGSPDRGEREAMLGAGTVWCGLPAGSLTDDTAWHVLQEGDTPACAWCTLSEPSGKWQASVQATSSRVARMSCPGAWHVQQSKSVSRTWKPL